MDPWIEKPSLQRTELSILATIISKSHLLIETNDSNLMAEQGTTYFGKKFISIQFRFWSKYECLKISLVGQRLGQKKQEKSSKSGLTGSPPACGLRDWSSIPARGQISMTKFS